MDYRFTANRTAFSLMELLVVVTIIAILFSMLMPLISMVKTQAKVVKCMSNLRQLGMITLLRSQDRKYIWQSCVDYNGTGIQAERMHRFSNDDPASRWGWWGSAQTEHQINLPEILEYNDGGISQFRKNNLLQCPASIFQAGIDVPTDVNDYWYKELQMPYVYTGWVSKWWDNQLNQVPTNDASRFCDRNGGSQQLMWSDFVFRWTGGTNNGLPQPPWYINHSPQTWTSTWYGNPPMKTINQCFGDGRVVTKRGSSFNSAAMEAMSDDPGEVLYIRSAGHFNDRRFF